MTPFQFEATHAAAWSELERATRSKVAAIDPERFLTLYRTACEHLALARARGYPPALIERLSDLTAAAHQIVYRQSDAGFRTVQRALLHRFPAAVRAHRGYVALAAVLLMGPALALGFAVHRRPDLVLSIIDSTTAEQFGRMYSPTNPAIGRLREADSDWMMFGFYIMNNIGIAFQCYVTGILFGVGSLFFLVSNGVFGGAIAGYVASLGYGGIFFPFIATHSAFEITAIVLSGAAGLRIGHAVLLPGRLSRITSLSTAARETSVIILGVAAMLVLAAAFEAFWSSAAWVTAPAKYGCAAVCWTLVALFFARSHDAA